MNFLDGLIVKIAKRLIGVVLAIGTGLVYLQFLGLAIGISLFFVAAKVVLFGV
ncbi:hypothetical protein Q8O96_30770 [Pseudomonas sp. LPH60]|uniref:hypothetical protein n=1 Tax=Pseudomonas sp. LPH60 TaxID=3065906 RepID=UPI00273C61F4|nr:hypothetical protein [Pseudomonas sp. LPH60]MDP4573456.1 hypothetical protein [Pseudomonas sp. LPH60]